MPTSDFPPGRQNICTRFWQAPRIYGKFAGEWKFVLQCYGRNENCTGCPPALLNNFAVSFINKLGMHSSWEAEQRDTPVVDVGYSLLSPLLCMEMVILLILRCPFKTPWRLTHTSQPNNPVRRFKFPNSLSNSSQLALISDIAAA